VPPTRIEAQPKSEDQNVERWNPGGAIMVTFGLKQSREKIKDKSWNQNQRMSTVYGIGVVNEQRTN
jgi:hypothetical protein